MSDKFKDERAANLTKPGEKPVDFNESEQSQGTTSKTEGAFKDERAPNLTKPGEQPMDPDEITGEKGADTSANTSKIALFTSGSAYRVELKLMRVQTCQTRMISRRNRGCEQ